MAYDTDGCRCFQCRLVNSEAKRAIHAGQPWREVKRPTDGTKRRLQALNAIGWTWAALGERLGMTKQGVHRLACEDRYDCIRADTAARVVEIYDRLWDVRPEGTAAHRARLSAARKGWQPPMHWDDDTIDDPQPIDKNTVTFLPRKTTTRTSSTRRKVDAMAVAEVIAGRSVPLNRTEVSEVVRTMTSRGATARQIGERLGITERSVVRYRAAARKEDAA